MVKHRLKFGFSLIELMIALVIIGILAGIAIPSYQNYIILQFTVLEMPH